MIEVDIPGFKKLRLEHLVLDYNGTLALDGRPFAGVNETIITLSRNINIHIITADTFGNVRHELDGLPCHIHILCGGNQDKAKQDFVMNLGSESTVCIGNGRNDKLMLKSSALGIAVIGDEGAFPETVLAADVVCKDILHAMELLYNPQRLVATLRC